MRDYKVASGGSQRLSSPSPFNIAVRSITLRNFTAEKVKTLLSQHTEETGQVIAQEAMERVFDADKIHADQLFQRKSASALMWDADDAD